MHSWDCTIENPCHSTDTIEVEYRLKDWSGRTVSVHSTADSALAAKWKKMSPRTYNVLKVVKGK